MKRIDTGVLVVNTGSTSVKLKLFDAKLAECAFLRGESHPDGGITLTGTLPCGDALHQHRPDCTTQERAVRAAFQTFKGGPSQSFPRLCGIGHRVVHGGTRFRTPVPIDGEVLEAIDELARFAPLHNPVNRLGIEIAAAEFPGLTQVAVFDTAFHTTLPEYAHRYAIPERFYRAHGFRRFGFHGISCAHALKTAAHVLHRSPDRCNLIIAHLGGGASITAVKGGCSVDTSMGFSPTEGLMMNSRCGDIDPLLPTALIGTGLRPDQVEHLLNRESGLVGVCGIDDMRRIQAWADSPDARLALDMYGYRLKKYIGAYSAVLGRVDALVFTGGIGEHAAEVRARALEGLAPLGYRLDRRRNGEPLADILDLGAADSRVRILAVAADEEREIARQTLACLAPGGAQEHSHGVYQ